MRYVGTFTINKTVYMVKRLLVSYAGLAPTQVLISCIITNITLATVNVCRPVMGFTNTNTAIPLAKFKCDLTGNIRGTIRRCNVTNTLYNKLATATTKVTATVIVKLVVTLVFGSGSGGWTRCARHWWFGMFSTGSVVVYRSRHDRRSQ